MVEWVAFWVIVLQVAAVGCLKLAVVEWLAGLAGAQVAHRAEQVLG